MSLPKSEKFDIYQHVTNKIIEELKGGRVPWQKPWHGVGGEFGGAYNKASKKPYSFLNQMMLGQGGAWASFKQWDTLGGTVNKGEKSSMVVFWKPLQKTDSNGNYIINERTGKPELIFMLRYYNVFHESQVSGIAPDKVVVTDTPTLAPIDHAEQVVREYAERTGLKISVVKSNKACYYPVMDSVQVPILGQYDNSNEYYNTLFHELVHSTGHASRLNRFKEEKGNTVFGSEPYSKEELVAEMGSAMSIARLGIDTEKTFKNSTAYLQSWIAKLANDTRLIVTASSRAEKATKFIFNDEVNEYTATEVK